MYKNYKKHPSNSLLFSPSPRCSSPRDDAENTPEKALSDILTKLTTSEYQGDVNLLLIQMIGTSEDGATLPDLLTGKVSVTGVLYGQEEAYNPWMQTLTEYTGGRLWYTIYWVC